MFFFIYNNIIQFPIETLQIIRLTLYLLSTCAGGICQLHILSRHLGIEIDN